ncbi:MAG: hypothetical protein QOJ60_2206 [Actinomycetota bacterium]|nr:hypothetical protein [Actinomycetota bacterium]
MDSKPLGASGVSVSAIGLGGFELGPDEGEEPDVGQAAAVLEAARSSGISWVDTSENYLGTRNESLIGTGLAQLPGDFMVATKAAPSAAITGGGTGFRRDQIHAACRESLRRLGRDHIDVYFLHWPDETGVPLEETWGAMSELVDDGLVRAIGMSNYAPADVRRCHEQRSVDVIQTGLSMVDYLEARPWIASCADLGIATVIYEPLASGVLTGKTREQVLATWTGPWVETPFYQRLLGPDRVGRSFTVADGLAPLAERVGATSAQLALAWVLHQPGVTAAIAGSRNDAHTRTNAKAAGLDITGVLPELEALVQLGPAFLP